MNRGDRVTLTTRLSLFFLALLGLVLAGFSLALYMLVSGYLNAAAGERLDAALNTLAAAAEVNDDGVEWEPAVRPLRFGSAAVAEPLAWCVIDDEVVIDQSSPAAGLELASRPEPAGAGLTGARLDWESGGWRVARRRVGQARPAASSASDGEYPELTIIAGISLEPMHTALRRLALLLGALSAAIWLAALVVGRAACRRALLPVARMARAAGAIDATDLTRRLPAHDSRDELAQLGGAFNSLLDRVQCAYERQQRFTGDASHQLRTPIAVILGQLEVALRRERPAAEYQRVMTIVHAQAGRLRCIVESLLFLARADAEALRPDCATLDLGDWLPQYLETWAAHPRRADIVLERAACEPCRVVVQPVLFGELLNVLLDNACKYSPGGAAITVRVACDNSNVSVQVADQGRGIDPADLARLFTPFFRAAESQRRGDPGVGLGLSIAQRLAALFGGAISVASQPGLGSCFTLRLPTAPAGA